jgi:hypothetical protein
MRPHEHPHAASRRTSPTGSEAFSHSSIADRAAPATIAAMQSINVTTIVNAPTQRVFDIVTDFEHGADTLSQVTKCEMLSDPPHRPIRVGSRFRETRQVFGKEATEVMEVASLSRPDESDAGVGSYTLKAHSHGADYLTRITVTPTSPTDDACELAMSFHANPRSLGAKLLSPLARLMTKTIRNCLDQDLADIKAAAERTSTPTPA